MPCLDMRHTSFVEADISEADCHRTTFEGSDMTRVMARGTIFERASLKSCRLWGADVRDASFRECNVGCCVVDEELREALDESAALLKFRIAAPHFCGHC